MPLKATREFVLAHFLRLSLLFQGILHAEFVQRRRACVRLVVFLFGCQDFLQVVLHLQQNQEMNTEMASRCPLPLRYQVPRLQGLQQVQNLCLLTRRQVLLYGSSLQSSLWFRVLTHENILHHWKVEGRFRLVLFGYQQQSNVGSSARSPFGEATNEPPSNTRSSFPPT